MPTDLEHFTNEIEVYTVPAGVNQFLNVELSGERLTILEASDKFRLELPGIRVKLKEVAGGYTIKTGTKTFERVRLINLSAVNALNVELSVGSGDGSVGIEYDYLRLRAVASRPYALIFDNAVTLDLPGIAPATAPYTDYSVVPGSRRRDMVIVHASPANAQPLLLQRQNPRTMAFEFCGTVPSGQSRVVSHDQNVRVLMAGVGNITMYLEENFYR